MRNQDYGAADSTKLSPTEEMFNEIECALKILSEAVERITIKTSDVRYCLPCDPQKGIEPECGHAPLIMRLRGIKSAICRNADSINNLSDEIQL